VRSLISIPAGFRRMPFAIFTLFTLIGSLVWNAVIIIAGYSLAEQWEKVLDYTEPFQTVVMVIVILLVIALIVRKIMITRRTRAAAEMAHPGLTDDPIEEIVDQLEERAETDPELRRKLHDS
jgi:ABC-type transport system involved in cytochrome bd biosynthesis fused ATPase/permease subunit